ncbi:hypothetical protein SPSP110954_06780 [Sporolactobacillus spathodeae]
MQILALFEHSLSIEIVLSALMQKDINKNYIGVFPLDQPPHSTKRSIDDVQRRMDLGFILATAAGAIGASIGFNLNLGPIIWGIATSVGGFLSGYLINVILGKRKKKTEPQIILVVHCPKSKTEEICHLLWDYQSIGLTLTECEVHPLH